MLVLTFCFVHVYLRVLGNKFDLYVNIVYEVDYLIWSILSISSRSACGCISTAVIRMAYLQ